MSGNSGHVKTVNKAQWWSRHGTHSVDIGQLERMRREKLSRPKPEMFNSIREAFAALRPKKRRAAPLAGGAE